MMERYLKALFLILMTSAAGALVAIFLHIGFTLFSSALKCF